MAKFNAQGGWSSVAASPQLVGLARAVDVGVRVGPVVESLSKAGFHDSPTSKMDCFELKEDVIRHEKEVAAVGLVWDSCAFDPNCPQGTMDAIDAAYRRAKADRDDAKSVWCSKCANTDPTFAKGYCGSLLEA